MALISPKVIAQVRCEAASELAVMSWEWVIRADGQVLYRLAEVDGRRERNPWTFVTQLPTGQVQSFRKDKAEAEAMLNGLARQHGHRAR
jgi:hypothetical protein